MTPVFFSDPVISGCYHRLERAGLTRRIEPVGPGELSRLTASFR
jgi:hypothetical protein